jgi:PAS domain S-box-containing protein
MPHARGSVSFALINRLATPLLLRVLRSFKRQRKRAGGDFFLSIADSLCPGAATNEEPWRKIVLENALDAVVGINRESVIIDWNRQAEAIFGWSKEEALGREVTETIIPPRYRGAHLDGIRRFLASGEGPILNRRVEVEGLRRDGGIFPVELTVIPLRVKGSYIFYSFLRDISERKRGEAEREDLRQRLDFLSEATKALLEEPLGLEARLQRLSALVTPRIADALTIHLLQDGPYCKLVELRANDPALAARMREFEKRSPPQPSDPIGPGHVLTTGRSELHPTLESTGLTGARSLLCVPLSARGRLLGALTLIQSESERSFAPSDLALCEELGHRTASAIDNSLLYQEAQDAVRTRDEFMSIASHELKTPLTTLRLQNDMSIKRLERGETGLLDRTQLSKLLKTTGRQLIRLERLIEDMLDISRISLGKLSMVPEEVELGSLAREVADRFSEQILKAGACCNLHVEGRVVGHWDRYRLEQVVANLVTNAIKYGRGKPIEVSVSRQGENAILSVRDSGIGIAPEDRDRIFRRFERAVESSGISGLGLGLYISREIVKAHGGTIRVESTIGEGSIFTVELPLHS